ncbi:MAG: hypothetical protein CVT90_02955 [Candidatus Altiarchaeales archaeon HGW-Altiarchaeales-3]|nr:MAG: hypothetical protein CVT90_02955 [Candidatus Altiarchaeales archaeon HGW-Altiarchaeales-3]
MDAYFPVMDPVGFFVFTLGPGLLFWTLIYILKEIKEPLPESSRKKIMNLYEKFSLFEGSKIDKLILILFTGIALNVAALSLITLLGWFKLFLENEKIPFIHSTMDFFFAVMLLLLITVIIYGILIIFYRNSKIRIWLDKKIEVIEKFINVLVFMIMLFFISPTMNVFLDTIYASMFVGMISFLIVIFLFFWFYVNDIRLNSDNTTSFLHNKFDFITYFLFLAFIAFILTFIPQSSIYNIQTSSPIHFDVITDNCINSTISSKLVLSNSVEGVIGITEIKPKDCVLKKDFELPTLLNEKEGLILYLETNRDELIVYRGDYYIHLKTTEGTIPIRIPTEKCEK